jgi:hypothetical protein
MLLLDDFLSGRATTSLLMGLAGIGVGVFWVRARRIDFFAPQPEPTPSTGYLYLGPGAVSALGGGRCCRCEVSSFVPLNPPC